ncbi:MULTISPECIES: flagellar assembly protein FliH [Kosakonia]|uniref:Flagellar assembly protein FliH n=1 Tax=Kosakonia quasisacchari TaxID=2529380 RepID=A0A4R0HIG7_9ENTR|nr:flagellar assembly protein FliH [Kosakonia quasisacchari]TCC09564.1 flagellar assembly protein FliH [Kosakonia quasisacchari]
MSTSKKQWQSWQPENLLQESFAQDSELREVVPASDPATEAAMQVELSRLRKQAEQKGFAQGQTQGLEAGKKQGYEDGFAQGREEGAAQGAADYLQQQQKQTDDFAQLFDNVKITFDSLDSVMPARLVQVALMAARSLLGESVVSTATNAWLMTRIQQLLHEDTLQQGNVQLWVSAEESAAVQEMLGSVLETRGWELRTDAQMLPGGCRLTTDGGELDATTETRWNELCNLSREDFAL